LEIVHLNNQHQELLRGGAEKLSLPISDKQIDQLLQFAELILKWNKTHNLTAITNPDEVVSKHLLDSLSICSAFPEGNALDVGSGAGLPGIPLSIINSHQHFTLVDSS
jgi:16S rRNA (guanine527-N7)-methyltransferase